MMSPALWSDVPFRNRTALLDFQGYHLLHHVVTGHAIAATGKQITTYPIGDGVGAPAWQNAHQQLHVSENAALGISGPPELADYDFNDPVSFATFMWVHAQETIRQMAAAGLV